MTASQILQKELSELKKNPIEGFIVLPHDNVLTWKVAIFGPPDSIYQGGYFKAELTFPLNYPFAPPKMRFLGPIWHPNIYRTGDICISILHSPGDDIMSGEKANERWNPTLGVRTILVSVISMLSEPNISSPANVEASVQYRAWKEKKNDDYLAIVQQKVEESKKDAQKDGIVVPENVSEYIALANNGSSNYDNLTDFKNENEDDDFFATINDDD